MTVKAIIDHEAQGLSRIATQYRESARFRAYIAALMAQSDEIEDLFRQIAEVADLDIAVGVHLDVIGDIVGVTRIVSNAVGIKLFGFSGQPNILGFAEENADGGVLLDGSRALDGTWYLSPYITQPVLNGGRLRDEGENYVGKTVLNDEEFRILIKARIVKNHSRGTNEDIIAGLAYLFEGADVVLEDLGQMAIGIAIGRQLTVSEVALIQDADIISRPAGVRIAYINVYTPVSYFGFDGQPGAQGFGDEGTLGEILLDGTYSLDGSWMLTDINSNGTTIGGGLLAEEIFTFV